MVLRKTASRKSIGIARQPSKGELTRKLIWVFAMNLGMVSSKILQRRLNGIVWPPSKTVLTRKTNWLLAFNLAKLIR